MIRAILTYSLWMLLLVMAQVLIFNNIEFSGFVNPYIYVLFILLLPFETPKALLIFLGFVLGLSIDLFTGTPGVHSSATIFTAFARPSVLGIFAPRDGYQSRTTPRVVYYGLQWFVKYSAVLVILHHLVLFYLEVFSFDHFFGTLLRALLSILFSLFVIIMSQFIVFRY